MGCEEGVSNEHFSRTNESVSHAIEWTPQILKNGDSTLALASTGLLLKSARNRQRVILAVVQPLKPEGLRCHTRNDGRTIS
jgi:hypothetical protein